MDCSRLYYAYDRADAYGLGEKSVTDLATRSSVDPLKGTLYRTKMIPGTATNTGATASIVTISAERKTATEIEFFVDFGSGPAWLEVMIGDINRVAQLPQGWDSYNGDPLKEKAALHSIELLKRMEFGGPAPWVAPTPDGGIHLEWSRQGLGLELEIAEDGVVEVLTEDGGDIREWTTGPFGDDELRAFLGRVTDVRPN